MRNYWAIVKKELHLLFVSPIAYVVMAAFFAVAGFFFYLIIQESMARAEVFSTQGQPFDAPGFVIVNAYGFLSVLLLFLVPMVTMASFAEERKRGTIELLFTSPITHVQIILGKFTSLMIFLGVLLTPALASSAIVYVYSQPAPPLTPLAMALLGILLLGGSLMAVGLFISSLTDSQIVAAVVTFAAFMLLLLTSDGAAADSSLFSEVLRYVSVLDHFEDFMKGVLDTQHVVFYLSFIFLGLFLTSLSLDSAKWRQ